MSGRGVPALEDLLRPGLRLVFCGTAAGSVSAARGAYYAHPQNSFWSVLHETGLTPRRLAPAEYGSLLEFGIGLTDIAKYVSGMDAQLPRHSLGGNAVAELRDKIIAHSPRALAFTSLAAGRAMLGRDAGYGRQAAAIGPTQIWILPSTSAAARGRWADNVHFWHSLAAALRAAS